MNTWIEDLRELACKLIDRHHDCPACHGNYQPGKACPVCYPLLGMAEITRECAKLAEQMVSEEPLPLLETV